MSKHNPGFDEFLKCHPSYPSTAAIDRLRVSEYAPLDVGEHIYLDDTGGGLYAEPQIRRHHKPFAEPVYGNSSNPTSLASTKLVERTRGAVLRFFNTDPDEYPVIFTANASGAFKSIGESYSVPNERYLLTFDNHNSFHGFGNFRTQRSVEQVTSSMVCGRDDHCRFALSE